MTFSALHFLIILAKFLMPTFIDSACAMFSMAVAFSCIPNSTKKRGRKARVSNSSKREAGMRALTYASSCVRVWMHDWRVSPCEDTTPNR